MVAWGGMHGGGKTRGPADQSCKLGRRGICVPSAVIPSLSVSRGCMASAEEEAAAAPPAEESAGMKQFYINEQRRQEMEHGQSAPLAGPQPGSCAYSGCTFELWVARHSKGEAQPLKAQPLPLVLEKQEMEHGDSKLALVIKSGD